MNLPHSPHIEPKSITRKVFIQRLVRHHGMTYTEAARAYSCLVEVFADAVVTGQKICVGRVLAIKPIKKPPRRVNKGFGGVNQTIHLGTRLGFKVQLYKEFLDKHQLRWVL